jgi:D-3-phosphoglycerate dehydrogenase
MNFIKCEKLEKSMAELQFSIDAEAFKKAVADVFKKEGKKYAVPGFRKGKAPRALIEKMYGADVFTYDAINELFPEAFEAAVKEAGVEPVGRPEVTVDSADELYSACDVVSLHIPATAETKNSINYALVNKMPKGGVLVNTARKEVINEAELIQLMEERGDLKYMTDIMPAAHETFAAKFVGRYFSTPKKMGAQTAEANINAGIAAAQQIVGFLKDGCEKFRVNKK